MDDSTVKNVQDLFRRINTPGPISVTIDDIGGGSQIVVRDGAKTDVLYMAGGWRWWLRRGLWWLGASFACGLAMAGGYYLGQWLFGSPW